MSHIHIPDGVLPLWIILLGWVVTGVILVIAARSINQREMAKRLPLLGVMSAAMVVAMTAEIVPIAYHINLSVMTGIILGPALGFIAAFIVNVILALFGHGGITVIGLNTLIIGTETVIGYYLFHAVVRMIGNRLGIGAIAAIATVVTLLVSTGVMIGVVALSNANPAEQAPIGTAIEPETLSFRNPFGGQILNVEIFPKEEGAGRFINLTTFIKLVLILGAIGWTLEGILTGFIARYIYQVRPDLLMLKKTSIAARE